jgi:hypothetical protein
MRVPPSGLGPCVNLSRVDGLEHRRRAWQLIAEAVLPDNGPRRASARTDRRRPRDHPEEAGRPSNTVTPNRHLVVVVRKETDCRIDPLAR